LGKPIQELIFKSRLTISYRTNITGTVTQERLPFRLLVLGNFSGDQAHDSGLLPDLDHRKVYSIKRGMTANHFISEIVPTMPIPTRLPKLQTYLPGTMHATLNVQVTREQRAKNGDVELRIKSGGGTFSSSAVENGVCDVQGTVIVRGTVRATIKDGTVEAQEANLEILSLVRGELTDPRTGAVLHPVTGNIVEKVKLPKEAFEVKPDEDAALAETSTSINLKVELKSHPLKAKRTIPFSSLESFNPDAVASSIPEIRRLLVIKMLLLELQASLRNLPELRKAFKDALPGMFDKKDVREQKLQPFEDLKKWALEQYPLLRFDRPGSPETNT
jgi:type VI secretion system ImpB/VipA family protein